MAKKVSAPESDTHIVQSLVNELKEHGGAYSFFEREDPAEIKQWISTGSTLLDYAISNRRDGGIPYGRITEINGLESTGKSLLALHIIANAQKKGGLGLILDTEDRLLEKDFLLRIGIDPHKLVINNPSSIEDCFESIEDTIIYLRKSASKKERPLVIVWDSLAATSPQAEHEGSFDPQSQIGVGAKAVARGIRKLTHVIGTENIALVVINQLRMNMKAVMFADPYVTPYGKALPYAASVRLRVTLGKGKLKDDDGEQVGSMCNVKVIKNSLGPPNRVVNFPLLFGYGIDNLQSLYDYLKDKGVIEQKTSGPARITLNGEELEFRTKAWKAFLAEGNHKQSVFDIVNDLMIKKYEDRNPEHDIAYLEAAELIAET